MNRDIKKRKEEEEDKSNGRMEREFLKNHSRSMVLSSFSHLSSPRPEFFFPSRENESVAINYFRDSTELRGGIDRAVLPSLPSMQFSFSFTSQFFFFSQSFSPIGNVRLGEITIQSGFSPDGNCVVIRKIIAWKRGGI